MNKIFFFNAASGHGGELLEIISSHREDFQEEYRIVVYSEPAKLLASVRNEKPQLIIIDESSRALRNAILKKYPFIAVIVYGKFEKDREAKEAMKAGASACMKMPFDRDNVISVIKQGLWHTLAKPEIWDREMYIMKSDRRLKAAALSATVVMAAVVVVAAVNILSEPRFRDKNLPVPQAGPLYSQVFTTQYDNPTGIAVSGGTLWVCDWKTQNIYRYSASRNLGIERIYSFPEIRFSAITVAGNFIYTCDSWVKKIYRHDMGNNLAILETLEVPGQNPAGITFDGSNFWLCDNATCRIYQLDGSLKPVKEFAAPGPNPICVCFDVFSNTLWSIDSRTNRIYRHRMDDKLSVYSIIIPPEYIKSITGMAVDRNYLWLCSEMDKKIYKYSRRLLVPQG